jgi:hypothetical protein
MECGYTWYYTGRMVFYATCPSCKRNIKIEKNKISAVKERKLQHFHRQVGRHATGDIATNIAPIVRPVTNHGKRQSPITATGDGMQH